MEVRRLFLPTMLTVLLVTASSCQSSEEDAQSEYTPEVSDHLSSSEPLQTSWEQGQLHDDNAVEDGSCGKDSEDCDSETSQAPSTLLKEESSENVDPDAASVETEGIEMENEVNTVTDGEEEGSSSDVDDPESSKVTLQVVGLPEKDTAEIIDGESEANEEEMWTEETEDGAEQKRSGGRRFFSLMNLVKFLLNPVIEEFQEMDKSATTQDTASAVSSNNQSDAISVPAGNSSEVGETDKKNGTESGKKTKFQCVGRNVTENTTAAASVRIVNSTVLLELLSFDKNHTSSDCVLVMFYAPWCHFCAATAPHYNAVARAFPQLEVLAVDTVHFSNLNARFGTVAVPNIMLFHQSRSAVRFNHTERHFHTLVQFITNTTGLEANASVELSTEDHEGPLSSTPTEETDYLLWFAWIFIVVCSGHIFIYSQAGQRAIERVVVLWQEHQHQHIE